MTYQWRPNHDLDSNGNTNGVRADRAEEAVETYREAAEFCDTLEDAPKEIIGDLIGDLLHLATKHKLDIDELLDGARRCFEEETQ